MIIISILVFLAVIAILITRNALLRRAARLMQIANSTGREFMEALGLRKPIRKEANSNFRIFYNGHPNRHRPKNKKLNKFNPNRGR